MKGNMRRGKGKRRVTIMQEKGMTSQGRRREDKRGRRYRQ